MKRTGRSPYQVGLRKRVGLSVIDVLPSYGAGWRVDHSDDLLRMHAVGGDAWPAATRLGEAHCSSRRSRPERSGGDLNSSARPAFSVVSRVRRLFRDWRVSRESEQFRPPCVQHRLERPAAPPCEGGARPPPRLRPRRNRPAIPSWGRCRGGRTAAAPELRWDFVEVGPRTRCLAWSPAPAGAPLSAPSELMVYEISMRGASSRRRCRGSSTRRARICPPSSSKVASALSGAPRRPASRAAAARAVIALRPRRRRLLPSSGALRRPD